MSLDLAFYDQLRTQFGASGGAFAEAYVIAHEYGHHVQDLIGTDERVGGDREGERSGSVRLELQADCYAGVWAHSVFDQLEAGDVDEAITASEAVGDDRLQRQAGRQVDPDTFTHGSAAQRHAWFERGRARGEPADCDTFAPERL